MSEDKTVQAEASASSDEVLLAAADAAPLLASDADLHVFDCLFLSDEQAALRKEALLGKNILILGGAGTGKSTLLNALRSDWEKAGKRFLLTSTTGISAMIIGGTTLHSALGISLGSPRDFAKIVKNPTSAWKETEILVVDEVSMLSVKLFASLEETAREIRGTDLPFGGIQLVLVGDFHQLPPVAEAGEKTPPPLFESPAFLACDFVKKTLRESQRAKGDPRLQKILSNLRKGALETVDFDMLRLPKPHIDVNDLTVPHLYGLVRQANDYNEACLKVLVGEEREYRSGTSENDVVKLKRQCRVLFRVNDWSLGLVNGSTGTVLDFVRDEEDNEVVPLVLFDGHREATVVRKRLLHREEEEEWRTVDTGKRGIKVMPLMVCYGLTVHKAQGSTFDRIVIYAEKFFSPGQLMTAISRVRSLEDMLVLNLHSSVILYDPKVIEFQKE